jgi:arginase family enzyme
MRYNVDTIFKCAAEEGLIDTNASLHIGPRGPTMDNSVFEHTRGVGFQLIDGDDLFETGLQKTADNLVEQLKDRTVYSCFDMDFFDPSRAPGVCTPTWGGATAREGLGFLRKLKGLNIGGADINTVPPPHDVSGMTAFWAGAVSLEILTLFCYAQDLVPE